MEQNKNKLSRKIDELLTTLDTQFKEIEILKNLSDSMFYEKNFIDTVTLISEGLSVSLQEVFISYKSIIDLVAPTEPEPNAETQVENKPVVAESKAVDKEIKKPNKKSKDFEEEEVDEEEDEVEAEEEDATQDDDEEEEEVEIAKPKSIKDRIREKINRI